MLVSLPIFLLLGVIVTSHCFFYQYRGYVSGYRIRTAPTVSRRYVRPRRGRIALSCCALSRQWRLTLSASIPLTPPAHRACALRLPGGLVACAAGLLFPSPYHGVLAVKVCAH